MNDPIQTHFSEIPPETLEGPGSGADVLLYHYTDFGGLLGMVKSRQFWCTNIHYQNDYQELKNAIEVADNEVQERKKNDNKNGSLYDELSSSLERISRINIFVGCFSENADQLSQWRGYAGGSGVSIGFRYESLKQRGREQGFHIARCIYDNQKKREIVRYIVNLAEYAYRQGPNGWGSAEVAASHIFLNKFLAIAPAFKHSSFAEEHEWRLISGVTKITHPQIDFRPKASVLIPMFKFGLQGPEPENGKASVDLAIDRVKVGPSREIEIAVNAVSDLLTAYDIHWRGVSPTSAPYRSL